MYFYYTGFNVESFQYKDLHLNAWDLGFGGKMVCLDLDQIN
jgi:hypothetical protein